MRFDVLWVLRRQCRAHLRVLSPGGQGTAICHWLSAPPGTLTPLGFLPATLILNIDTSNRKPLVLIEEYPWHVPQWKCRKILSGPIVSATPSINTFTPP